MDFEVRLRTNAQKLLDFMQFEDGTYELTLRVPDKRLGEVMSHLGDHVSLVSVVKADEKHTDAVAEIILKQRAASKPRDRGEGGITGAQLIINTLAEDPRPYSIDELGNLFVKNGFKRSTASTTLYKLSSEGKVRPLGAGKYMTKNPVHTPTGNGV